MNKPAWVSCLMATRFFGECRVHGNCRKNEKNIFCLNCCQSFCPHCIPEHHPHHPLLQVRRYVYQDVIRLDDLEKLIDCTNIQAYTINSAKVIFLKERSAQSDHKERQSRGRCNTCFTCHRILQHPFNFCSLSCKVDYMALLYEGEEYVSSNDLFRFDGSDSAMSQLQLLRVNVDASEEDPLSEYGGSDYAISCVSNSSNTLSNQKEEKKGSCLPSIMLSAFSNRSRKRTPHRSPLS